MLIDTIPATTNLYPISLSPSVNDFTIRSIKINASPNIKTSIPTVKNTLNNGYSLAEDILLHHLQITNEK